MWFLGTSCYYLGVCWLLGGWAYPALGRCSHSHLPLHILPWDDDEGPCQLLAQCSWMHPASITVSQTNSSGSFTAQSQAVSSSCSEWTQTAPVPLKWPQDTCLLLMHRGKDRAVSISSLSYSNKTLEEQWGCEPGSLQSVCWV